MEKSGKIGKSPEKPRKIGKMHQKNRSCIRQIGLV
uniref:Uncharacterized protein n=1 Tax=viral metagenome TaxID=1070528 RepID=A0A6C0F056_9ZZZZ